MCASPSYVELHGRPSQIEDLSRYQAIIYSRSARVRPWLFPRNDQPPVEVMPVSRLRLDDMDTIADAATAGMGLAWLPLWLIKERIEAGRNFFTTATRYGCRPLTCRARSGLLSMRWQRDCPNS